MTLDVTLPRGGMGVLKIGHEDFGARVQRVDDHFSFYRAGDLYAAVQEILGNGSYSPLAVTDMLGFGEEIGQFAGVDLGLSLHPALQEFLAPVSEGTDQGCNEVHSIRRQYLGKLRSNGAADIDPRRVVGQVLVGHRLYFLPSEDGRRRLPIWSGSQTSDPSQGDRKGRPHRRSLHVQGDRDGPTSHVILRCAQDLYAQRVRPFAEFTLERSEGLRVTRFGNLSERLWVAPYISPEHR